MGNLGILDLLCLAGFRAAPGDRMVRHQHGKYPVAELRRQNLLEVYQAYQGKPVFRHAKQIVSLYGLDGTKACFFGVFRNLGERAATAEPLLSGHPWETEWRRESGVFYRLERQAGFEHLEGRVVIDWGKGALAWCQRATNKTVLEITAPGRRLPPFSDYLEFSLSYDELVGLFQNEDAHAEWRARLSAVAGVYLVLAEESGDLYVGSAAGAEGVWGRWRVYARTGHGNNRLLREVLSSNRSYSGAFRFSLLQILPKSMSREDVIEREVAFKAKLGSRAHGLNLN